MYNTLLTERSPATNRRLAKKRVQCLNEVLCFVSSSMLADSLVLRNPLLRQAPKRYLQFFKDCIHEKYLQANFSIYFTNFIWM
jgi:hypothetical protein